MELSLLKSNMEVLRSNIESIGKNVKEIKDRSERQDTPMIGLASQLADNQLLLVSQLFQLHLDLVKVLEEQGVLK